MTHLIFINTMKTFHIVKYSL